MLFFSKGYSECFFFQLFSAEFKQLLWFLYRTTDSFKGQTQIKSAAETTKVHQV